MADFDGVDGVQADTQLDAMIKIVWQIIKKLKAMSVSKVHRNVA